MPNCAATTKTGKPCPAAALRGGNRCYFHAPEKRQAFLEVSARGGKVSRKLWGADLDQMELAKPDVCRRLLQEGLRLLMQGQITPQHFMAVRSGMASIAKLSENVEIEHLIADFARATDLLMAGSRPSGGAEGHS